MKVLLVSLFMASFPLVGIVGFLHGKRENDDSHLTYAGMYMVNYLIVVFFVGVILKCCGVV